MRSKPVRVFKISLGMMLTGALLFAGVDTAQAAAKKDPAKQELRRMQMALKQAQDEKAALEQEKAGHGQELEALKKKMDEQASAAARAKHAKAALEKESASLRQDKARLTEEVERLKKELAENQSALRDTSQNLRQETSLKQRLEQNLSARGKALDDCHAKNKTIYQYHVELLNRAQSRGSLDVLLEAEPVLGFKRVQIEQLMEVYRDKLDEQKVNTTSFSQIQEK